MTDVTYDDYLAHYGVKGMKWGKRKRNPNYSDDQKNRDTQIYGKRGAKRINKNMNKGDSVSTARSREKTRRDEVATKAVSIRGRTDRGRQVRQVVGGGVGAALGTKASSMAIKTVFNAAGSKTGQQALTKVLGDPVKAAQMGATVQTMLNNPKNQSIIQMGAATAGGLVGAGSTRTASRVYARSKGYNPDRL